MFVFHYSITVLFALRIWRRDLQQILTIFIESVHFFFFLFAIEWCRAMIKFAAQCQMFRNLGIHSTSVEIRLYYTMHTYWAATHTQYSSAIQMIQTERMQNTVTKYVQHRFIHHHILRSVSQMERAYFVDQFGSNRSLYHKQIYRQNFSI